MITALSNKTGPSISTFLKPGHLDSRKNHPYDQKNTNKTNFTNISFLNLNPCFQQGQLIQITNLTSPNHRAASLESHEALSPLASGRLKTFLKPLPNQNVKSVIRDDILLLNVIIVQIISHVLPLNSPLCVHMPHLHSPAIKLLYLLWWQPQFQNLQCLMKMLGEWTRELLIISRRG